MSIAENIAKLGLTLPTVAAPAANYLPYQFSNGHLYLSGQLPKDSEGHMTVGQLGAKVSVEEGKKAARVCGINMIGAINAAVNGDWSRVKKIVKITCFVSSSPDFSEQHVVANGCSDLLVEVFGKDIGCHARCAVGMAQLPLNASVEIDAIVEVSP
ncbi:endoribonuclease L-PSP (pb5) [Angomonas deanei]|uniref:YjgF/chorismate_mutase-like, putative endoribonuclease/Endoribonuclease L-PSP, putative n=1 Tax=Angomonas deanei TaxID=59799 RepID=S9WVC1_9TRYP|nr:endoribonuclease L-PSP (pb5) [Angomonas deanei]EPY43406.1 endoribonuclease L-PSP (pb5) [Angomonas deanei]CAD2219118.1 YjgF/chorismate_mutase-like, putative endoribonuclease/Endoribonuclease L-PSP, putative [Angomonas deanei]|eukprot:EPY38321.1 endoribonuclease L-PSP (pb5) [Angomonas deanei]